MLGIADAGELQDVRRTDGAGRQDHLARGIDPLGGAAARKFDAGRAAAVEQDAVHQRAGDDLQIAPPQRGPQVAARGTRPPAAAARLLHPADPVARLVRQVVDVLAVFATELPTGFHRRPAQQRPVATMRGEQRSPLAVHRVRLALPVLRLAEERQHIVPGPAAIAELCPMVEILGLAADIDHPVDRTRPAEHPPARIGDRASRGAGVGLGLEAPGQGRMVQQLHVACRYVDQRVPVAPARLDQHHPCARVLRQAVGEHTARRTSANDDVIRLHAGVPPQRPGIQQARDPCANPSGVGRPLVVDVLPRHRYPTRSAGPNAEGYEGAIDPDQGRHVPARVTSRLSARQVPAWRSH